MIYKNYFKRLGDLFAAILGLTITFPIFFILLVALTITNKGKPFFFQKRPGRNGKIFSIIKFKSMTDEKDAQGDLLPDEDRMTNVGEFVRKTSLDEIPQLINILIGDMSLIGPRPLRINYLELYSEKQHRRHLVRPGVTGLAQVNGRNAISWFEKFEYDIYYVDHLTLKMDWDIYIKTLSRLFKKSNLENAAVTTKPFTGNN